ncbi:hypothetical protein Pfo_023751 [Paulownia fortunei]|nr:hypothetical protein Pfo_023751 [Paulownia fortunei]
MDTRKMKRGRGNPRSGTTTVTTKKKAKQGLGKAKEVGDNMAEEPKVAKESFVVVDETAELGEWAGLWSGVDEEMSWATCWCPFWEMEAIEDAYDALYEDVLWDYDIWDLRASGNAPNS